MDVGRRSDGQSTQEKEELQRLRRENKQLRREREILAKAAAWFARETDAVPRSTLRPVRIGGGSELAAIGARRLKQPSHTRTHNARIRSQRRRLGEATPYCGGNYPRLHLSLPARQARAARDA
jgi:hypothetical protein